MLVVTTTVGMVDGILVDRAFTENRATEAVALAERSDLGAVAPQHTVANAAAAAALGQDREPALRRLACTLTYSMAWRTPDGERRHESRTALSVVPLPDLLLDLA